MGYTDGHSYTREFFIEVVDPSGAVWMKPAFDDDGMEEMQDTVEKHVVVKSRYQQLMEDKNDIDTNMRNDDVERRLLALSLFGSMKSDRKMLDHVCGALFGATIDSDITSIQHEVYRKAITEGHKRDHIGLTNIEKFISIVTALKKDAENKPKPVQVRFAHMIDEKERLLLPRVFNRINGFWERDAFSALATHGRRDYRLSDNYSATLLDDKTILVYDHNYKKPVVVEEPLWTEDDFVVSQLK